MNRTAQVLLPVIVLVAAGVACSPARKERPAERPSQQPVQQAAVQSMTAVTGESLNCKQQTTYDGGVVVTLADARKIAAAVAEYLATAKPKLERAVLPPDDPFIDCEGAVRMGEWWLEPAYSGKDLQLTFAVSHNDMVRVDQYVTVRRVGAEWKAVDTGTRTAHREY